ncbi:aspartate carbamoyltransferase regulatory subunit [Candidatus Woesearchaeota archaeon CG_4_10_14_0_8_um_filter_47_5]|nr:MAG: aspartate carbamoyltransferase regulatory subunit [Candidatus Woesearchaeota archaeon CG_4_10_14_0_8_um_filter_47_5]
MAGERKEHILVSALRHGTVIDHIPLGHVFKVLQVLGLQNHEKVMAIGVNLESRKYGRKDILKVEDREFNEEEAGKLALIAPDATLNIIREWKVAKKIHVSIPDMVTGITCVNPRCITRYEPVATKFSVLDKDKKKLKLRCAYCEHDMEKDDILKNLQ